MIINYDFQIFSTLNQRVHIFALLQITFAFNYMLLSAKYLMFAIVSSWGSASYGQKSEKTRFSPLIAPIEGQISC